MDELVGPRLYCCFKCRNQVSLHDDIISKAFQMDELVGPRLYCCFKCRNQVSLHDDIISKAFQGSNGRAFLFSHAMNIVLGAKEDRRLMTGLHTVADIYCGDCREVLGWKYERAFVATQKYKEGKFILEKSKIVKESW